MFGFLVFGAVMLGASGIFLIGFSLGTILGATSQYDFDVETGMILDDLTLNARS